MEAPPFPEAAIIAAREAIKAHLRIVGASEDAVVDRHAATALALCEAFTGAVLILRAHTETLNGARRWQRLAAAPVRAITAVSALDPSGVETALPADAYAIDIDAAGTGWVRAVQPEVARLRVLHAAGLAESWDALPPPIAQGVVLLAAHLFDARGGEAAPPAAVSALWRPWRRMRLHAPERAA